MPARWLIWWTPGGVVCDPVFTTHQAAPPETVVEGFAVLVPTSPGDPTGSGALANALVGMTDAIKTGPDRLGAALADGIHGLTLEAVFQPDATRAGVDP